MTTLNDRWSSKGALVLGMLALAACAGCASATRPVAVDTSSHGDAAGQAAPATIDEGVRACERDGGWYDRVAGACDSDGS
jgi:hypothetical protein